MKQIDCIYNNNKTAISIVVDGLLVGNKKILYKDIYAIRKVKLHLYFSLFFKGTFLFSTLMAVLLFHPRIYLIKFLNIYVIFIYFILIALLWMQLFLSPKIFKNEFFLAYDIFYRDSFDTILVKSNINLNIDYKKIKPLPFFGISFLRKYQNRVAGSRKYLFSQIETSRSSSDFLLTKYTTVAKARYAINQNFSLSTISIFEKAFKEKYTLFSKLTFILMRLNILIFILTMVLFLS